ncbi:MAG: septum formation protein Maf [Nitrospira sp.]|uniref:dTTP/UTP pyrophosphatase n=1 Tax=Nitrospira defluvii TaxID=330214 RepID=A0ABN7LRU0_9BACT|nr:Maf family protein [Nitrospira defluvii]MCS6326592.1 septum formation protein Maf [Nitrospira sp.]CAE6762558.1 dTTP/UTP pyrophosphatase [Nitrospira defluvii]
MRLILASTSPRRRELLTLLGMPFEAVAPPFIEEVTSAVPAEQQAMTFAIGKARSCLPICPDGLILGSDTLISLEQEVMGKPADLADAEAMLRRLAGRTHRIVTAVALVGPGSEACEVRLATVLVTMKPLHEAALAAYLCTGDSLGKAGAYSIQAGGATLIERIEGDYTAAVGLPLRLVAELLRLRGMPCPVDIERLYARKPYPNWQHFEASH